MKFPAKKDTAFSLVLLIPIGFSFLMSLWFLFKNPSLGTSLALVATLIIFYGLYYLWTHTFYEIKDNRLYYHVGFFKGNVPITKISLVKKNHYPSAGNRPALSFKGITIIHGSGSELFIAPENVEGLIAALQGINQGIEVKV